MYSFFLSSSREYSVEKMRILILLKNSIFFFFSENTAMLLIVQYIKPPDLNVCSYVLLFSDSFANTLLNLSFH